MRESIFAAEVRNAISTDDGLPDYRSGFLISRKKKKWVEHQEKKINRKRIKEQAKWEKEEEKRFPKETIGPTYESNGHVFCSGCNDWIEECYCWVLRGEKPPE